MNRTLPLWRTPGNPRIGSKRPLFALLAAFFGLLVASDAAGAEETVDFPSQDADLTRGQPTIIQAKLYKPDGPGPFPAVVGLHGCGGRDAKDGRPNSRFRMWTPLLVSLGYVVLLPDSFGPRGVGEVCSRNPQAVTPILQRPRDAYGALAWLVAQPYVRADRVFLMGWSHGGGTVLATLDTGKRAVPRPPSGAQFRGAIAFYPGCRVAAERSDWRTGIPLLILNGELDDWTPASFCQRLLARAGPQGQPVELKTYPGAYHDFDEPQGKVRQLGNIGSKNGGSATLGPDPAARADALERVPAFLRRLTAP